MIDILVDKIVESLDTDLTSGSVLYTDGFIEAVTNKNLVPESMHKQIAVLEGDSAPVEYQISDRIANTKEKYVLDIQLLVRAASEQEGKRLRRTLTSRIKHSILRKNGEFFSNVLGSSDSGVGYSETPQKYEIIRTQYDNAIIDGDFLYMSVVELAVETDVNYYE